MMKTRYLYDAELPNGEEHFLKIRRWWALIPLFAVETLEPEIVDCLPDYKRRNAWLQRKIIRTCPNTLKWTQRSGSARRLYNRESQTAQSSLTGACLDETEFSRLTGVRALSRFHEDHPYARFM